jgi:hypothetical protein
MLRSHHAVVKKGISSKDFVHDEFIEILIHGKKNRLHDLVQKLAERDNPTLKSIIKIENLFKKHIEFNSRTQLLRELDGSMKATSLNTIIARLVDDNKIVVNDDHSLTWIDTEGNAKLNKQFSGAVPI